MGLVLLVPNGNPTAGVWGLALWHTSMSQSGNDDFADARYALFVSTLCHAGQVVYLGVRTS